jgi:hypothetical protein
VILSIIYIIGIAVEAGESGLAGSGLAEAEVEAGKGGFLRPLASEKLGLTIICENKAFTFFSVI